ncbi:kielin/chordin-like protein [Clavelina lepadiformis]|uniref:kielin/chordin-like protein n=1 Tax=Clavelina lepadiformis TaxID=159417 RepID=UPI004040FDD6
MKLVLLLSFCFLEETALALECPNEVDKKNCLARPCDIETCPAYPNAKCTNKYCGGCMAVFTDESGNQLSDYECCYGQNHVPCIGDPCEEAKCPGRPEAVCIPTRCRCGYKFVDSEKNVLTSQQCSGINAPRECPSSKPPHLCFIRPCKIRRCPAVPTAECVDDYCDGCKAIFLDDKGNALPHDQCRKKVQIVNRMCPPQDLEHEPGNDCPSQCPSMCPDGKICCPRFRCGYTCVHPLIQDDPGPMLPVPICPPSVIRQPSVKVRCTKNYMLGSVCVSYCDPGARLIGEPSTIKCEGSGRMLKWNPPSLVHTKCERCRRPASCFMNPCATYVARCPNFPLATCVPDFCTGCNFYFKLNEVVLTSKQCYDPPTPQAG